MSPLCGAGLLRCVSSRCPRTSSRPDGRLSLARARRHPPRSMAHRVSPDCSPGALPGRSRMQRSRLRLHRDAEQPGQAGAAGGDDDSDPFPCPGIAGPDSFTLRVNEARLTNWPACRSLCLAALGAAPARSSPRPPAKPDAGPLKAFGAFAAARPPRQSLRLVARRSQGRRRSWCCGCLRDAAPPAVEAARAPVVPPRSPHQAPVNG